MRTGRLEAFSDGVIAIIITIMVLEMKAPDGADLDALRPVLPALLSGARTLLSTATKTLQDQLFVRDLPRLRNALELPVTERRDPQGNQGEGGP